MATIIVDVHRQRPFDRIITAAIGDDLTFRFPLKDENGDNITSGTVTSATLVIKDKPSTGELLSAKTTRATIAQAAMTVSLPNIDVPVNVTKTTIDWTTQVVGNSYWAKFTLLLNGSKSTPSEFEILVTD